MGTVITLILGAAFACCALTTLAGLAAMRADRAAGTADPGGWDGPLIFASLSIGLATILGLLPPLAGAAVAVAPLLVIVLMLAPYWGKAVNLEGSRKGAALRIAAGLFQRARELLLAAPGILRDLSRGQQPPGAPAGEQQPAAPAVIRPRREPSTARPDPVLGPALVPEQVAAELEAARVAVPAAWAVVAEWIGSFEPEDEDDWRLHMAENAAGILRVAETIGGQAEDFASGIKLDPGVTSAHADFADDLADTASAAARVLQAYDRAYEGINEHVDNGGTLVEDARRWHGAGGPEGAAA